MAETNVVASAEQSVSVFKTNLGPVSEMVLSPEGWTAFWHSIKTMRAGGWKPSVAEQAILDAAYKAGKAAGLGRQSKAKAAASPEGSTAPTTKRTRRVRGERLPSGQSTAMAVFHNPEGSPGAVRVYRRWFKNAPEAYSAVDATLEALRAQMDKAGTKTGTFTITVKDYTLNETWSMKVPVQGTAEYSFKQVGHIFKKPAPQAAPAPKAAPAPVRRPYVKKAPQAAPKNDIKAALKAALQGLQATQAAILAAVNAL